MKKILTAALLALVTLVSCSKGDKDPRLVIITFDGLRWQELFSGADESLVGDTRFVRNPSALKADYWKETPEERRAALMPFVWSYVPEHGYLIGNRNKNSLMQVFNNKSFSYPGYSEMFCGWADDERIIENDPIPNPNVSVMEVANKDPRYKDHVMVYGSWESIRFAVNNERGGFPGSTAYEQNASPNPSSRLKMIDRMMESMYGGPRGGERPDAFTYAYAMETLRNDHPKLLFVSFGATDEYGHGGEYDKYLEIIRQTDG
ncbi:MAG: hypothetical protein IJQ93_05455, partial [Bacteroidales bacterium]|nr:hypothetical protein [Bacteroidales bacterium]